MQPYKHNKGHQLMEKILHPDNQAQNGSTERILHIFAILLQTAPNDSQIPPPPLPFTDHTP